MLQFLKEIRSCGLINQYRERTTSAEIRLSIYIYIELVFCGNEDCCSILCELHFLATLSRMLLHPLFLQVAASKVLLH